MLFWKGNFCNSEWCTFARNANVWQHWKSWKNLVRNEIWVFTLPYKSTGHILPMRLPSLHHCLPNFCAKKGCHLHRHFSSFITLFIQCPKKIDVSHQFICIDNRLSNILLFSLIYNLYLNQKKWHWRFFAFTFSHSIVVASISIRIFNSSTF